MSFSQNIYPKVIIDKSDTLILITPSQLKSTNLIFVQHKHLKLKNEELTSQNVALNTIIRNNNITLYNKNEQLQIVSNNYELMVKSKLYYENQYNEQLKRNSIYKDITIGCVSIGIVTALAFIIF